MKNLTQLYVQICTNCFIVLIFMRNVSRVVEVAKMETAWIKKYHQNDKFDAVCFECVPPELCQVTEGVGHRESAHILYSKIGGSHKTFHVDCVKVMLLKKAEWDLLRRYKYQKKMFGRERQVSLLSAKACRQ